ncbi:MAG: hypothetical protein HBSAPP03_21140 [Phycisphaerae bacterium]|nr:MAG: hypothetical protein HBSAPP03_21140 [Phycisphaerae bacterium]
MRRGTLVTRDTERPGASAGSEQTRTPLPPLGRLGMQPLVQLGITRRGLEFENGSVETFAEILTGEHFAGQQDGFRVDKVNYDQEASAKVAHRATAEDKVGAGEGFSAARPGRPRRVPVGQFGEVEVGLEWSGVWNWRALGAMTARGGERGIMVDGRIVHRVFLHARGSIGR